MEIAVQTSANFLNFCNISCIIDPNKLKIDTHVNCIIINNFVLKDIAWTGCYWLQNRLLQTAQFSAVHRPNQRYQLLQACQYLNSIMGKVLLRTLERYSPAFYDDDGFQKTSCFARYFPVLASIELNQQRYNVLCLYNVCACLRACALSCLFS